jgi:solute carrier family 25 citrate transporter 1
MSSLVMSCFSQNLGANFTAYQELKTLAHQWQPSISELPSYQHMIIGLISGAMGPFTNAPIDTIKTRAYFRNFLSNLDLF